MAKKNRHYQCLYCGWSSGYGIMEPIEKCPICHHPLEQPTTQQRKGSL